MHLLYLFTFWQFNFHYILSQTLSSWGTSSVEEVASTGPGIRFFQLYVSILPLCLLLIIKFPGMLVTSLSLEHNNISMSCKNFQASQFD